MAGLTQAEAILTLDARFPTTGGGDYVAYSINGTTESTLVARHAVGATGWAGATAAQPSIKANGTALTSGAATGSGTLSHFAVFSASSGGTQRTDWQALTTSIPVITGTIVTWAIGALAITLD
jgi:hypothetical protein